MEIAYAAHTKSCTLMLDADGVCRWVITSSSRAHDPRAAEQTEHVAAQCIGAQYVASIDMTVEGGLVVLPRVGLPMLFARVDPKTGRISLVRTGRVTRFEARGNQPIEESDGETTCPEPETHPRVRGAAQEEEVWEADTRKVARYDESDDGLVDPDDDDTETARVDPSSRTLQYIRRPSADDLPLPSWLAARSSAYELPTASPQPRGVSAMPDEPRHDEIRPPPPTISSATLPRRMGPPGARRPMAPLPPPPGYAPRVPPPPPRRSSSARIPARGERVRSVLRRVR